MANKRMICAKYKNSTEWRRLTFFQQCVYYGLLLETDDDGIVPLFYSVDRIVPSKERVSSKKFEEALKILEEQKLIHTYSVDEFRYVQFLWWLNDQKLERYKSTQYPKSECYLEKPPCVDNSPNRNYYDEQGRPLPNVATKSLPSISQLNKKEESLKPTTTQISTQSNQSEKVGEWVGYKILVKWLTPMENITNPEAYARSMMAKYPKNVILKAVNNSNCTSLAEFYKLCTYYLKQQPDGK